MNHRERAGSTRTFTFRRINPTPKDYQALTRLSLGAAPYDVKPGPHHGVNAYVGYSTLRDGGLRGDARTRLVGFIVLPTRARAESLHYWLPNFLVVPMVRDMDWDGVAAYDVILGEHPLKGVRRNMEEEFQREDGDKDIN